MSWKAGLIVSGVCKDCFSHLRLVFLTKWKIKNVFCDSCLAGYNAPYLSVYSENAVDVFDVNTMEWIQTMPLKKVLFSCIFIYTKPHYKKDKHLEGASHFCEIKYTSKQVVN